MASLVREMQAGEMRFHAPLSHGGRKAREATQARAVLCPGPFGEGRHDSTRISTWYRTGHR